MMSLRESSLPLGNFHLDISARLCRIHSCHYPVHMPSHQVPSRIAQNDDRYTALPEILLKTHVLISC